MDGTLKDQFAENFHIQKRKQLHKELTFEEHQHALLSEVLGEWVQCARPSLLSSS
jgi:hypothetical protein